MNYLFKGIGIIKSSTINTNQKPNWYYVSVDTDFSEYYNSFIKKGTLSRGFDYPRNGPHITFIAGEKEQYPINIKVADSYLDQPVTFFYDNTVYTDQKSFWLNIFCPQLDDIRIACGLDKRKFSYHLTLGNIKNFKKH